MRKKKIQGDVGYYLPNKKIAIACNTKATSDLIGILSEIFYSISDVQRAIFYDEKAIEILQIYIDNGYGETEASEFFQYDDYTYALNWFEKPYAILISNFPFMTSILDVKGYLEFNMINGVRKWKIKEPFKRILQITEKHL